MKVPHFNLDHFNPVKVSTLQPHPRIAKIDFAVLLQDRTTVQIQYAISSLSREMADAAFLLAHWRGHWGIENRLHWVRDVSFGEDKRRVKMGHGPYNLAIFGNAAINLLRLSGCREIAAALRDFSYRPANSSNS